jgi:hypothetical protein
MGEEGEGMVGDGEEGYGLGLLEDQLGGEFKR